MPSQRLFPVIALCVAMPFGALTAAAQENAVEATPPAGTYRVDPYHVRLMFEVNHLGFSEFTGFFRTIDATLAFDPADPEAMHVEARIETASVETLPPPGADDLNTIIAGESFLDAANFPEITFRSTAVRLTGPQQAAVTGDLTLHGVTRPITLKVRYNGGYAGHPLDPGGARIGFSAEGAFFRSDFGVGFGIPAPGSRMGVGDLVSFRIETEMLNPDAPGVQVGP